MKQLIEKIKALDEELGDERILKESNKNQTDESENLSKRKNGKRLKASLLLKFLRYIFSNIYFRVIYVILHSSSNIFEVATGWWIVYDAYMQENGLVYGPFNRSMLKAFVILNIAQSILCVFDIFVCIRYYLQRLDTWFWADLIVCCSIWITEIPFSILSLHLSSCQETSFTFGQATKTMVCIIVLFYSTIALAIGCVNQFKFGFSTLDDKMVIEDASLPKDDQETFQSNKNTQEQEKELSTNDIEAGSNPFLDIVQSNVFQKFWFLMRLIMICGMILVVAINSTIFKITYHQNRHGPLEWQKINQGSNSEAINKYTNKYLTEVDVFLKLNESPWIDVPGVEAYIHVDSFERIIRHGNEQKFRMIEFSKLHKNCNSTLAFTQSDMYAEIKKEQSVCYNYKDGNSQIFEKANCPQDFKPFLDEQLTSPDPCVESALSISLYYEKPNTSKPFGSINYKAWLWTENGMKKTESFLNLIYARNTVPHQVYLKQRSFSPQNTLHSHEHIDRSSGPFRPFEISANINPKYLTTYSFQEGDIIPIDLVWRTGIAMCQSTALSGPTWKHDDFKGIFITRP